LRLILRGAISTTIIGYLASKVKGWSKTFSGTAFPPALGAYLLNGMFHDVSVLPTANMTLFFLAGATAALRPLTREPVRGIIANG
jgi:hypothetical protein